MPYILPQDRRPLDEAVDTVINAVRLTTGWLDSSRLPSDAKADGCLNYVITQLLVRWYRGYCGGGYVNFQRALGLLTAVSQEFYRRVVAPYEDTKREANGDVFD